MIYSMTGFGRGEKSNESIEIAVEIKTVNNRYCDIIVKMPRKFNCFEDQIKRMIKEKVKRGRVDVYINVNEVEGAGISVKPNIELLDEYVKAYRYINDYYDLKSDVSLGNLLRIQDGIIVEAQKRDEEEYLDLLLPAVQEAIDNLVDMRALEGEKMSEDVLNNKAHLETLLVEVEKFTPLVVQNHKEKMLERISEILEKSNLEVDEQRMANEIAIFADKTDISEEIVRIKSHLSQLEEIFKLDEPMGRKLDFLIQELNREVNTIGSKSPDIDISCIIIDMKSQIEKMREQVQNIE